MGILLEITENALTFECGEFDALINGLLVVKLSKLLIATVFASIGTLNFVPTERFSIFHVFLRITAGKPYAEHAETFRRHQKWS